MSGHEVIENSVEVSRRCRQKKSGTPALSSSSRSCKRSDRGAHDGRSAQAAPRWPTRRWLTLKREAALATLRASPLVKAVGLNTNATSDATRAKIRQHALKVCAVSPHKRDQKPSARGAAAVDHRAGAHPPDAHLRDVRLFSAQHPNLLKLAEYKEQFKDVCWEATHAYREGWRARPV